MSEKSSAAHEYTAAVRMVGDAAGGVAQAVERMHEAIARRPFAAFGRSARPARQLHDSISELVYTSVKSGLSAGSSLAAAAAEAFGTTRPEDSLVESPLGRTAAGIISGVFGERADTGAGEMTIRIDGERVPVDHDELARAFPDASGHVVVFLHGLIETERWWYPRVREGEPARPDFGTRLSHDLHCTPVHLRYNTGLNISTNGLELAELLTDLLAAWPATVERISLVGHSMGGLVARSAAHQAVVNQRPWADRLAHVICLGSPHKGAPLEVGAHMLSWALRRFDESAPLGELLELRSEGIKDLRYGYLHDQEWERRDADKLSGRAPRPKALLPEGARQYFLTVTVTRDRNHPIGRLLGDLLVTPDSADDLSLPASRAWAGGMHHFDLLHHDGVYERIRAWLGSDNSPVMHETSAPRPRLRDRLRRKRLAN